MYTYQVNYYYYSSLMDCPDDQDMGLVDARSEHEAKLVVAERQFPGILEIEQRDHMISHLTATLVF